MAITYRQVPAFLETAFNPLWMVLDSTYSGETGFKYVVQLQDVDGTIATKYISPFPDGKGKIDLSTFLKSKLSYTFNHNPYTVSSSGYTTTPNAIMEYRIFCGHTGSTNTSALAGVDLKYVLNGADTNDNFYHPDYLLTSDTSSFLTDSPRTIYVNPENYYTFSWINGKLDLNGYYESNVEYMYLDTYKNNAFYRTYRIGSNPYKGYTPSSYTTTLQNVDPLVMTLGVGPMNLKQINSMFCTSVGGDILKPNIITDDLCWYDIYSMTGSTQTSYKYRFIINETSRWGNHQIAFLNRLGAFSYFTFNGKVTENIKQDTSTFSKNRFSGTNTWTTTNKSRGTSLFNNEITTQVTLVSDYIDQDTYNFMEELFTSPILYYIDGTDAHSMIVVDTDWVKRKTINDKVINFTIKLEYSNKKYINV